MNAIKSIFPQRLVKSLLTAGMFCMGISACADDTAAPEKSFSIADIAELERFYDSYANKRIELPGSGYESGDIVQFIDTGISHNTYTMQYEQTGDGLLVTLPDNLASSEYGIYIVRGGMKFLYGKSYFGRFDSRRLTAGNHPRLLMDSSDFETLKAQLAVADPTSLLARHAHRVAWSWPTHGACRTANWPSSSTLRANAFSPSPGRLSNAFSPAPTPTGSRATRNIWNMRNGTSTQSAISKAGTRNGISSTLPSCRWPWDWATTGSTMN